MPQPGGLCSIPPLLSKGRRLGKERGRGKYATPLIPTLPYAGANRVRFEGLAKTSLASQRQAHPQLYVGVL